MRVNYIVCKNCGRFSPAPYQFYVKGELTEEQKKTCIWEVEKQKEGIGTQLQFKWLS